MTKYIKEQLIKKLAPGKFISGQQIGDELGISRAAVSKHIASLNDMGLDVFSVTGKGYRLAQPVDLLDKSKILSNLSSTALSSKVEVHTIIDSTNSYLMRRMPSHTKQNQVCVAEFQSAGRGRRGRQWISPFGSHLYFSMYRYLEQGMSGAMGLSVATALAINDVMKSLYDIEVELKWPNDIYLNGKKLAGVLIDLEGQALEPCHSVIGIGLNINMPAASAQAIDQPWTDLQSCISEKVDRNQVAAKLASCLIERLSEHQKNGILHMVDDWQRLDRFYGKQVKLITGDKETFGICRGINNQGALLLEVNKEIRPVYGGEVSLRGAE